ncbi:MAG: hypothetical protein ACE5GK_00310 [Nitrospiria bacterium]
MGKVLIDPEKIESDLGEMEDLGLLDIATEFRPGKITARVSLPLRACPPLFSEAGEILSGYEIHAGISRPIGSQNTPLFTSPSSDAGHVAGLIDSPGLLFGTRLYGLFENDGFRRRFVNVLRIRKGLTPISTALILYRNIEDRQIEDWAGFVSKALNLDWIEAMIAEHHR